MSAAALSSVVSTPVLRVQGLAIEPIDDVVSIEQPLQISLQYEEHSKLITQDISVTMRTPGNDIDLAFGFLYNEHLITTPHHVASVESYEHTIQIRLTSDAPKPAVFHERNFISNSSCGLCGKSDIASIYATFPTSNALAKQLDLDKTIFYLLPQKLQTAQLDFAATGGIHASALFSTEGDFMLLREDVGRHNALDKLIGAVFQQNKLPLDNHILLLSGRVSYELVQKASMAGIRIIAAIGAPSSMAVDMAIRADITLIGFLKSNRYNIYHQSANILLQ